MRGEGLAARLLARPDGERRLTNCAAPGRMPAPGGQAHPRSRSAAALAADPARATTARRRRGRAAAPRVGPEPGADRDHPQGQGARVRGRVLPLLWDGYRRPPRADDARRRRVPRRRRPHGDRLPQGLDDAFDADDIKRLGSKLEARGRGAAPDLRRADARGAPLRARRRRLPDAGRQRPRPRAAPQPAELARRRRGRRRRRNGSAASATRRAIDAGLAARSRQRVGAGARPRAAADRARRAVCRTTAPRPSRSRRWPPPRHIASGWCIGSYSALAHGAHARAAGGRPRPARAAAGGAVAPPGCGDDRRVHRRPTRRRRRPPTTTSCASRAARRRAIACTRCSSASTSRDPPSWPRPSPTRSRAARSALPAGAAARRAAARTHAAAPAATTCSRTPLPVGTARPLRLADVARARRLIELEFHLPVARASTPRR